MGVPLERIKPLLICPECGSRLEWPGGCARCTGCGREYPVRDGRIYFVTPPPREDAVDGFKERLRRLLGKYYYSVGIPLLSLSYVYPVRRVLARHPLPPGGIGLYAGSGNQSLGPDYINADLGDYDNVDVVCDITRLPFADTCLDAVVTKGVLEHLPEPGAAAREFARCTKAGGAGIHFTPFLYPFHASPHDYFRFTHMGVKALFDAGDAEQAGHHAWTVREQINTTSLFTLFPTLLAEYASELLSFGKPGVRTALYFAHCLLLFPIKFLDVFLVGKSRLLTLCTSMLTVLGRNADRQER